jgi:DNA-binding MarR family transcriptional regulator
VSKNDPPFDLTLHVRDHCLCLHVRRAARALARRYDEALKPAGLTNGQFSLLMSLNRPEPPTMGEVAAVLDLDPTTLTANLKPLQRRGLLDVMADEKDRRSRRIALTDEGRAVLAAALPLWRAAQAENEARVAGSAPDDLRQVLRALS